MLTSTIYIAFELQFEQDNSISIMNPSFFNYESLYSVLDHIVKSDQVLKSNLVNVNHRPKFDRFIFLPSALLRIISPPIKVTLVIVQAAHIMFELMVTAC